MNSKTKGWLWVLALFLFIGTCLLFWKKFISQGKQDFPPIPVEVTKVEANTLTRSILAAGLLIADQAVIIRPEIDGIVETIDFADGQFIESNERLIHLQDASQQADLLQAQAKLVLSKAEYKRAETLLQTQAISTNDRDIAFSALKVDEALVAKAEAELAKTNLMAPFSGKIGIRKINKGDYVTSGQDIVNLVKLDPLYVDFKIPETYLTQIKLNQGIEISGQPFQESIPGTVSAIDPQIDPVAHSIYLRAEIPNTHLKLMPGLFVTVRLILEQRENVLFVPETALMPQGDKQFVYVVKDNQAVLTEIKTGEWQNKQVEVRQGLKLGETVITAGQVKIQPGAMVNPLPHQPSESARDSIPRPAT